MEALAGCLGTFMDSILQGELDHFMSASHRVRPPLYPQFPCGLSLLNLLLCAAFSKNKGIISRNVRMKTIITYVLKFILIFHFRFFCYYFFIIFVIFFCIYQRRNSFQPKKIL